MLNLYDAMTQTVAPVQPLSSEKLIRLYVCGVTVYDRCHIGHARVYTFFDTVVRVLRGLGYTVRYVRNITDIDDKIIQRAQTEGCTCEALTEKNIKKMHADLGSLGCQMPEVEPKATEHIPEMHDLIKALQARGLAYTIPSGDVLFSVNLFDSYGSLSHRSLSDLIPGHRVAMDEQKAHPLDFVLWKAAKPGEPTYDSPWGGGRPGWHIECSAMAQRHLGHDIEIHGGGYDLLFPHHENERAQSEGAHPEHRFVRHWVHVGFVQSRDTKMSKSLGNFVTIEEALTRYPGEAIRLFLLSTHYRSPLHYTEAGLQEAKEILQRWYRALALAMPECASCDPASYDPQCSDTLYQQFWSALCDEMNLPIAIRVIHAWVQALHKAHEQDDRKTVIELGRLLRQQGAVLGLLQADPQAFLQGQVEDENKLQADIRERDEARAQRDWHTADQIRDDWLKKGIILEDSPSGTTWRKA